MELRCPECCSEVARKGSDSPEMLRCDNCGARFERGSALVPLRDVEPSAPAEQPQPLFTFNRQLAAYKLCWSKELRPINPYSDADEVDRLFQDALTVGAIRSGQLARIVVYPESLGEAYALLGVARQSGPTLLGPMLDLRQEHEEDPVTYTLRILGEGVEEANALAGAPHPDTLRLDRIAAFMNEQRPWNGGNVCEFVARELRESGRRLREDTE